ncbi:lamin tail domain-containing protein, partial [Saprospiraceae bacterium]|nr:lamin tail domain-containing protein [Saprospiraceae bacterium]
DSDLIAFLDQQFGSGPGGTDLTMRPWFINFQDVFTRWEELTGVTYVYEVNDDGASFGGGGSPGVLNTRGDLRIGGHRLDGNSGVLACNYFPNNGDMIFDTDDNFYSSNNILGFENVISHEHGHGLGFSHSCPINQSKLMEPFISTAFDGPQEDDILAGNRQYGDPNENNNTSATAKSLGTISSGNPLSEVMVSIDDDSENDFYSFTTTSADDYNVTVTPTGTTYLSGPQLANGNCDPGTNFNALIESNIGIELIDTDGSTILATSNAQAAGFEENICNSSLSAGTFFVRVFGDANSVQMYDIEIEQGTATCAACGLVINEVDYDQGATDDAEFIELFNPCGQAIDMSTYSIQLINGGNNNTYETINLSGTLASGDYYVICTNSSNTPNCDLELTTNANLIQDGAPDAIALFDGTVIADVLSYEGNVTGFVEGTATGLMDDGSIPSFGLSRIPNGSDSDNNDNDFSFTLATPGEAGEDVDIPLSNPTMCQVGLTIPDNNCDQTNEFSIIVNGIAATQLGTDVVLKNVDLIISHTWLEDLDISLISPNGAVVDLSSDNGDDADNYGDPTDTSCQSVTSFDMSATTSIINGTAPFVGSFIPEGNFTSFNDGSNPNGIWILRICDDFPQDEGQFEFAELVFELTGNNNCPPSYSQANGNMLTGTQSVVADFETDGIIESDQIIDADVIYDSGSSIEMESGFEVFIGRVFEAFIDGCGNLFREESDTPEKE